MDIQRYNPEFHIGERRQTLVRRLTDLSILTTVIAYAVAFLLTKGLAYINQPTVQSHYPFVNQLLPIIKKITSILQLTGAACGVASVLLILAFWLVPSRLSLKQKINSRLLDGTASAIMRSGMKLPTIKISHVKRSLFSIKSLQIDMTLTSLDVERFDRMAIGRLITGLWFKNLMVTDLIMSSEQTTATIKIENAHTDWQLKATSFADLQPKKRGTFLIDKRTTADWLVSPHMLISGRTRSGKSMFLVHLLASHLHVTRKEQDVPDEMKSVVSMVDPKGQDFARFKQLPNMVVGLDPIAIYQQVEAFELHMTSRMEYLGETGQRWQDVFEPSVLVLDEYASIGVSFGTITDKDLAKQYNAKNFNAMMLRLISRAASSGCFIVVSIVQADSTLLPTNVRAQFLNRLAMRPDAESITFMFDSDPKELTGQQFSVGQGVYGDVLTRPKVIKTPYLDFEWQAPLLDLFSEFYK